MALLGHCTKFQPYKHKRSNTADIVMLFILIVGLVSVALWYTVGLRYPMWIFGIMLSIVTLIRPGQSHCLSWFSSYQAQSFAVFRQNQNAFSEENEPAQTG